MLKINHVVAMSLTATLGASLVLIGCDRTGADSSAEVKPASQQTPTQQPEALPQKPATPTEKVDPAAVAPAKKPPMPVDPGTLTVRLDPSEVDFGEVPTNESVTRTVKLVNTGDTPMTIVTHRVTCGCTALDIAPNYVMQPREVKEVKVQLNATAAPGPIAGKKVTFVIENHPEVELNLHANAVAFVIQEPETLTPEKDPEGILKFKSRDGTPFRILSMQPPVVAEFSTEAKTEHEIKVNWDRYREFDITRKAVFYFDHPKCQSLMPKIEFSQQEMLEAAERRRQELIRNGGSDPHNHAPVQAQPLDAFALLVQQIKEGRNDEVLRRVADGSLDLNARDNQGVPVLSHAAKLGNVELMNALINGKADIEATDNAGRTPLMHAAMAKNNLEAVQALLDKGASVTARDTIGGTALTWASGFGDATIVKELLDAGADVDIVGRITGWTPLIWASGFGDANSIKPLVDTGANIEIADFLEGATPMIHAARTGKVESIHALLKAGANIEGKDLNGKTPLLAAAANSGGDAIKVKALLEAGANAHATDNRGYNALQLARKRTDARAADVIKLLEPVLLAETPADPNTPAAKAKAAAPAGNGAGSQ